MSIVVRNSIPLIPDPETIRYRETVRGESIGHFIVMLGHLEGWKFRRASHAIVSHSTNYPGGTTMLQDPPNPGVESYWFSWYSQRRAKHVGIIIGYQAWAASGDPTIQALLYDRSGAPVLIDQGCEWTVSGGQLNDEVIRRNAVAFPTYPIRYVTTTARKFTDAEIAAAAPGFTIPRVLTIPDANQGNRLTVELRVDSVRPHSVTVFERPEILIE